MSDIENVFPGNEFEASGIGLRGKLKVDKISGFLFLNGCKP
jgi:hypothetical protein